MAELLQLLYALKSIRNVHCFLKIVLMLLLCVYAKVCVLSLAGSNLCELFHQPRWLQQSKLRTA